MAVFKQGDMYAAIGTMMFSAGSNLTPGGELVMDKSIKDKINRASPRFEKLFGQIIQDTCGDMGLYGLIFHGQMGIFQTGYKPRELNMNLFKFSMSKVSEKAKRNWFEIYNLDLSSIGNGNGEIGFLMPVLEMLPDNVRIWETREDF